MIKKKSIYCQLYILENSKKLPSFLGLLHTEKKR